MRPVQQMRMVLRLTTAALIMVLALTSTGAQATGSARIATACSNETVNAGFGNVTGRFVLHRNVSCREAHRTMQAYARAIADGRCTSEICSGVSASQGLSALDVQHRRPLGRLHQGKVRERCPRG